MKKGKAILGNSILITIVVLIIAVFGYYIWKNNKSFVPQNFIEARANSAAAASDLVSIMDESVKSLVKISEEDRNYNYSAALDLVNQESNKMEKAHADYIYLSEELIKMAQALKDIRPDNAKQLAFEAVSQEALLIEHVVNYSSYFTSLLNSLKQKFLNEGNYNGSEEVRQYINNMNREAGDINFNNEAFNQKLREFDKAL